MNEKRRAFLESEKISLSRLRDLCEKRKRVCGALLGTLMGFIAWNVFYFTEERMSYETWRLFIVLLGSVSVLVLFIVSRKAEATEKRKRDN